MPFIFTPLEISDVILIEPKAFEDERGFFVEYYKKSEFVANGIDVDFVQDNHSRSTKGVLRGLHYQLNPNAQGKLVRCIKGEILDVAVDIRKGSPTFGKWVAEKLTAENKRMLYIPEGFAHGFYSISDVVEITYKVTAEYAPESDRSIRWDDPQIDIAWSELIDLSDVVLSDKDMNAASLKDADVFSWSHKE